MTTKILSPRYIFASIIVAILIIWAGSNVLIYSYINRDMSLLLGENKAGEPEVLKLNPSDLDSETFYFYGMSMKMPFYSEDIESVVPEFIDHELGGVLIKIRYFDRYAFIRFRIKDNDVRNIEDTMIDRIRIGLLYGNETYFDIERDTHYSDIGDFVWWDLFGNIKLLSMLRKKERTVRDHGGELKIYEVETPYISGISLEGLYGAEGEAGRVSTDMTFVNRDKKYSVSFIGVGSEYTELIRRLVSTIRIENDLEKISGNVNERVNNTAMSRYPSELDLLSLLSLRQSPVATMIELRDTMRSKGYGQDALIAIENEIAYIKGK